MRILHLLFALGHGGIETWLIQVLRGCDPARYQHEFIVQTEDRREYEDEVESLGFKIHHVRRARFGPDYGKFLADVTGVMRNNGPYDIFHAHGSVRYGHVLREADKLGIPHRVMHSHNMKPGDQRWYLKPLYNRARKDMMRHTTAGLACSVGAAEVMFGPNWQQDGRFNTLFYGIDLSPFDQLPQREEVRQEFNLPPNAKLISHIGRFVEQKNHDLLIETQHKITQRSDNTYLMCIGDGPDRQRIEQLAHDRGITDRVIFTGNRKDVPRLLNASDLFMLPSRWEGLGLVLIEAQAARLPCLISQTVPEEAAVAPGMVHRRSIDESPQTWAQQALELLQIDASQRQAAFTAVQNSPFNITRSIENLSKFYDSLCSQSTG